MIIQRSTWLQRCSSVINSLNEAIEELRRHQNNAHSARVMRHRLEGKRYVVKFIRALIDHCGKQECDVNPVTATHVWHQFLVEYPRVGPQLDDSKGFTLGEPTIAFLQRNPDMTLTQMAAYLGQYACSGASGTIQEIADPHR